MALLQDIRTWIRRLSVGPNTRRVDVLIGVPLLHLLWLAHRRRRSPPVSIRRVGIFCAPTTGDTVLFSAILLDLRRHFGPDVFIVHFCGVKNRSAAQLLRGADRIEVIHLTHPLAAARTIRAEKLDLFFDASSSQRVTAILALTSRAFAVGYNSPGQYRHRAFDAAVPHRADQHELENYRDLLRAVGIPVLAEPAVDVPPGDLPQPWHSETDIVVFHLWPAGGKLSLREWPEDHWIALAQTLARPDTIFAITGAPSELVQSRAVASRISRSAGVRAAAFEGEGGLVQLVRLLRRARLVVSVNTGIMHLAAVVGAPTVSLNGPTAGHRWGPHGPCCVGVSPADGSGGYLHLGFELDPSQGDVMPRITPAQVADAAHALLARCGNRTTPPQQVEPTPLA